jgi:RecB family exonuclease
MAYSASRLETLRCLFRFRARYLLHLPEVQTPEARFGSFIHRVTDRYVRLCCRAGVDADPHLAVQALETEWALPRTGEPVVDPELYDEALAGMQRFAERYRLRYNNVLDSEMSLSMDASWKPVAWDAPTVRVRGRVDLLEVSGRSAIVSDWKTQRQIPSQAAVERMISPRMYAALVSAHNPGITQITVEFWFWRHGVARRVSFSLPELDEAKRFVERQAQRADQLIANSQDASAFPATPSTACVHCSYQTVCPAKDQLSAVSLSTLDEAEAGARRLIYRRIAQAGERARLKEWVAAAGPIHVDDQVLDFHRVTQPSYDMAAIEAACRRHGIPLRELVRPDRRLIEQLSRAYPAWGDEIRQATTDVGATRFGFQKEDAQ